MPTRPFADRPAARLVLAAAAIAVLPFASRADFSPRSKLLLSAAASGDVAAIGSLLAQGTAVDSKDVDGRSALLVAVERNHLEAARALIAAGADINLQARNLDSPWLLAGARGRTEMLREMIPKGPDYRLRNRYGGSALIPACHYGHVDTVRLLLTTRIDVDHVNDLGWTCLLELVILGDGGPAYVEIARAVLAAGANPNLADKDGVTPLAHARRQRQSEVAKLIEAAGGR
jgi:hypothetical protein